MHTRHNLGVGLPTGRQARLGAVLGSLAFLGMLGACRATATPGGTPASVSRDAALATLTAVAGPAGDVSLEATPAPGSEGQGVYPNPIAPESEQSASYRATQAAADATAGIADVSSLVDSMPPLATFTPDAKAKAPSGRLVYVRGGVFRSADAAGAASKELAVPAEVPAIWSPPQDPGRAWESPDNHQVAFFAGTDAELWVMGVDGRGAARISEPNLPTDLHEISVGGRQQAVRLRPGQDYTLVCLASGDQPVSVLVDDNSRHIRGEARLRVVHASSYYKDTTIEAMVSGMAVGNAMAYGQSSGDDRVYAGQVEIELLDEKGRQLSVLPAFDAGDMELKTVFLYGSEQLKAYETSYEPSSPASGNARVRVFNATDQAVDVTLDGQAGLATGLASGAIGKYQNVASVMGVSEREDARISIYGLRSGEEPVSWSPSGDRVAFLGAADGQIDLYLASLGGQTARLTDDTAEDANPRWSPDGSALVFQSVDPSYEEQQVRVWRDGNVRNLDLAAISTALKWPPNTNVQFPGGVDWADNTSVFLYPKSSQGAGGLWLYDTATGSGSQLFADAVTEPSFSPEASAWALVPGHRPGQIITLGLDGKETTVATSQAHFPLWSPDAKSLCWLEGETTSGNGWRMHVMNADGSHDRVLTDWLPVLQSEPPVPGPNAKRWWLDGGRAIAFTRAGRDYGAAERAGAFGKPTAGDDIENLWIVATDGKSKPVQATDLTQVFYMTRVSQSPKGDSLALVGFSYKDRVQQLWTLPRGGGKPTSIDGGVRWFVWTD